MTKTSQFLVPRSRALNMNKMVNNIFGIPDEDSKSNIERSSCKNYMQHQSAFNKLPKTGVTSFDKLETKKRDSDISRQQAKYAMRYIKKKLWEKGIGNANIYVSTDTLNKISEKLLRQSDSMGPDQKMPDNGSVSTDSKGKLLSSPSLGSSEKIHNT